MIIAKAWDSGPGGPLDRYTVIYTRRGYGVYGRTMSADADSPQGVCLSLCGPYTRPQGNRVKLDRLPDPVRRVIAADLADLDEGA